MTDISDQATDQEEKFRAYALRRHAAMAQTGDTQSTVCHGCSYATKKSWGYTCESWKECLKDSVRLGIVQ